MASIWASTMIDQWISDQIKLNPPAARDAMNTTEKILDFQFPPDFKELYLIVDGFADSDWTKNMFSIWPLAKIADEYHQNEQAFIAFADYLIHSHHIGFVKGQKGIFKHFGEIPVQIADTFSEAISLIHLDSYSIY